MMGSTEHVESVDGRRWAARRNYFYFKSVLGLIGVALTLVLFGVPASAQQVANWPVGLRTPSQRVEAVQIFADGLSLNDAEAIRAGWRGRKGWSQSVTRAVHEARSATDPQTFGVVLRRLYASYPSLHSHLDLRPDIDIRTTYGAPYLPFTLKADKIGPGITPSRILVASVADDGKSSMSVVPVIGDEVVAIDNRPIAHWLSQVASICRRNSRWQCYDDFDAQLRGELLGWDRRRPLQIDVVRSGVRHKLEYVAITTLSRSKQASRTGCAEDALKYDGFEPVYTGWNLCVFGSRRPGSVEIWRLKSFRYPSDGTINSVQAEVDRFWLQHWQQVSRSVSKILIDVTGNGGGSAPMPWYGLLFDKPYQEQFAQYLRLPAYDNPDLLAEALSDEAHDGWVQRVRETMPKAWNTIYRYLPPVPQFCIESDLRCSGDLIAPKPHSFKGSVSIILDDNCVSSCSGFAWNLLTVLSGRSVAYGLPDSGDSNYTRMPLKLTFADGRWETSVGYKSAIDVSALVTANVMVSRTTDRSGRVLSGASSPVALSVDRNWDETLNHWANRVVRIATHNRR